MHEELPAVWPRLRDLRGVRSRVQQQKGRPELDIAETTLRRVYLKSQTTLQTTHDVKIRFSNQNSLVSFEVSTLEVQSLHFSSVHLPALFQHKRLNTRPSFSRPARKRPRACVHVADSCAGSEPRQIRLAQSLLERMLRSRYVSVHVYMYVSLGILPSQKVLGPSKPT